MLDLFKKRTDSVWNWWIFIPSTLVGGIPTRLKNDGVRQLGPDDIPNWMESHNPAMFQSPPTKYLINQYQPLLTTINHH